MLRVLLDLLQLLPERGKEFPILTRPAPIPFRHPLTVIAQLTAVGIARPPRRRRQHRLLQARPRQGAGRPPLLLLLRGSAGAARAPLVLRDARLRHPGARPRLAAPQGLRELLGRREAHHGQPNL